MRPMSVCILVLGVAASCARPLAPPGGERDITPPRLVSTVPEPLAVIEPGDIPVVLRFDESLSERSFTESLVTVSPLDSAIRVDRSGSSVRVRIDGGWRANRIYRVVLLPGVRDRFGNARTDPVELVFSTGPPIGNTALAGVILDRLTGLPAPLGIVDAVHVAENARYRAVADSTGFYSLRYLPLGRYEVAAFDDQNRNRRPDWLEPVDSGYTARFDTPADTVTLVFRVLSSDTTAPTVTRALALDSLHVGVELDDAIEPQSIAAIRALVHVLPDSTPYAAGSRIIPASVFEAARQAAAAADTAAADTIRPPPDTLAVPPDTLAVDTVAVPPDTVPVPPDTVAVAPDTVVAVPDTGAGSVTLPLRELVVLLDRPLPPGTYTITLIGVTNLYGLTGGGTARFEVVPPPPPPPPDTAGARPDTAAGRLRR